MCYHAIENGAEWDPPFWPADSLRKRCRAVGLPVTELERHSSAGQVPPLREGPEHSRAATSVSNFDPTESVFVRRRMDGVH